MSLPLLAGDYASQLWQRPPSGVSQAVAYGPGGVIFGSEETNSAIWVDSGDYVSIEQDGDYDGSMLLRIKGAFRANTKQTDGDWQFFLKSDTDEEATEDWSVHYRAGWEQRFDDLALNVLSHTGTRTITLGLKYTGASGYQVLPTVVASLIQIELPTTEVALINRVPAPSATRIPHTLTEWRLDIADFTGNGVDLARTVIHINGYKVYDAGNVGSYNTVTSLVGPGSNTSRFVFTVNTALPAFAFLSEMTSRISVSTYTVGGTELFEEDYEFVMDDILAPVIYSVESLTPFTLRVTWDDVMRADGSLYGADNPENYAVSPLSVPAYTPEVVAVTNEDYYSYVLTFDQELTFGASYEVLASSSLEDHAGNPVDLEGRARPFTAMVPEGMELRSYSFVERVPAYNLERSPEDLQNFLESLQDTFNVLAVQVDDWSKILDPATAPEQFLDSMLADLGFPFVWDDAEESMKRRWVTSMIDLYALKGTAVGIVSAIRVLLGIDATIYFPGEVTGPWVLGESELGDSYLTSGDEDPLLYSFGVLVDEYLTAELTDRIRQVVLYFKCPHEHLIEITSTVLDPPVTEGFWILGDEEDSILGSTTVLYG